MAVTQNEYTGNGSATTYSFTFPYLQTTDVKVKLDGVTQATTAYTFPTATTVQMNSAPGSNVKVLIYRDTGNDNKKATFYPGSAIKAEDLNDDFDQILYTAQEIDNYAMTTLGDDTMIGNLQMGENQLVFEGATADAHETSIGVVDPTADRTINFPDVSGNVVTTGDTGTVTATMLANVSVNTTELVDSAITTDKINTAAVTTAKIAADAVTGAKIADDQINSEHYVAGSIDTEHIADSQITTAKVAASAITTNQIADDAVTAAKLASNSVVSASIVDGTIVAGDLADNAVTTAKINADAVTGAKIADDQINSEHYIDGSIDTAHLADDAVTSAKIAANAVTTSELADAELTTLAGMQSGTASILASGTALAATTTEINSICDGKTVQTTISDTDASYPTSGAVVDYVAAQIAPLGGLEVIGDEDSFPSQPASGVVISIADAGGIVVNGSGVSTTARTSGNGSDNVTINGFPSTLYNTTLTDNMGLLVSSTGSSNTYTYHKLLGKESDIKTLSDDINDFNARYRIASSAPSSNNDDGDLYFDTTAKKMKVYNGSTSQWDDVAQSSSSHIVTLSESFNGSLTDFTMSTAATDAQSTIVSINGVIQKPNSGTSTPAEGFAISGNTLKLSNAPATGSTYFVVVLGDTVSIGTPSDNTVATAKIQNLAVTGDKIATNLDLADNKKIRFGTGNDLNLYHDGTHSYIKNSTGYILIESDQLQLRAYNGETMLNGAANGSVELRYDDVKKFETTSYGFTSSGYSSIGDGTWAYLTSDTNKSAWGNDQDLQIYHNGNSFITTSSGYLNIDVGNENLYLDANEIRLRGDDGGETLAKFIDDGAVELYYDGEKKVVTSSSGLEIYGTDGGAATLDLRADEGTNDTDQFRFHVDDGGPLYIRNKYSGSWETNIMCAGNGAAELYYDNAKKLETLSTGISVTGKVAPTGDLALTTTDNQHIRVGASNDLYIYHDGGNNWVDSVNNHPLILRAGTGIAYLQGSTVNIGDEGNVNQYIRAIGGGAVEIYHNNAQKFTTNTTGVSVTGYTRSYSNYSDATYSTSSLFNVLHTDYNSWTCVIENSHDSEPYGLLIKYSDDSPDDNGHQALGFADSASYRFLVYSDGDTWTSDAGTLTSDETLKENITDATSKLEDIKKLKVRNFNWKSSYHPQKSKKKQIGFIAQEVEEVFPALVSEHDISPNDGDGNHTPVMKKAIKAAWDPIIIKAMQELITKVETLETKVAALEAK